MITGPRRVGVLGVPTSAGSHYAGQEKAPQALRECGMVAQLRAAGLDVEDFGDTPSHPHQPHQADRGVRNLDGVTSVVAQVADAVAAIVAEERLPLVLGGDCTITIGVVSGLARRSDVSLVYVDGDVDLGTPDRTDSGVLDTMGVTHLLGGGIAALARIGPWFPLLSPERLVLYGFAPADIHATEWTEITGRGIVGVPAPAVRDDAAGRAAAARTHLEARSELMLVHFDVDVIDSGAFPLANYPHFAGLGLEQVATSIEVFAASPRLGGLVVTEVNPDHDQDRTMMATLIGMLCHALAMPGVEA